ncbi:type VI secretion system-associated FHA domain protein TagH [Bosea sp. PAMC 26642]|uniref:type VI secretion system-associated FHA domain protein TagH n=1 Tax=Bosea sp. (strain PAMC 26642) TaxID=1792307 RepID=UPI0009E68F8F|nr:type VI secretion system-associated FHA domain protein TagH [Bosea sp. PAMC 26642]
MALTLTIENEASLPDGGPLSVTLSGGRGLDIGRDQHLDWTLPDPSRAISGRHCEVRYKDKAYWLRDVSTNGTFINGASQRVQSPYRLRHGDRMEIGHYIIAVTLDQDERSEDRPRTPVAMSPASEGLWGATGDVAPPIPRRDMLPPNSARPINPGFIDWAADLPGPVAQPEPLPAIPLAPATPQDDFAWAPYQPPPPVPVEQPAPIPTPRRPAASSAPAADPWDEAPVAAAPAAFVPPPIPVPQAGPTPISAGEFMQRFAKGAGLSPEVLNARDPGAFAEELGALMRLVAIELKSLLSARAESKRIARSSNQTMIQAEGNNPLKFSPTIDDAMRLIFGRTTAGYLNAELAFEESFKDLKAHQIKTYSAMQHALRMLVEDLDPQAVAESMAPDRGLEALIGSRKAKMWDTYVARWEAKTAPFEDGLVDAFMLYFAECYDRGGK